MMKKSVSLAVILTFILSSFTSYADINDDLNNYTAQMKQIHQELKQSRDNYREQMKATDEDYMDKFKKLDKGDVDGRKALLDEKKEAKKKIQMNFREKQEGLRQRIKETRDARKALMRPSRTEEADTSKETPAQVTVQKKGSN